MDTAQTLLELGGIILGLGILGRIASRFGVSPHPSLPIGRPTFRRWRSPAVTRQRRRIHHCRVELGVILLLFFLRDLFAAVFFVFFGMQTDARAIPPVLGTVLLLGLVTALTKIFVGMMAARKAGIGLPGQVHAGTLMAARGEFNIVIAGLATAAGIVEIGPLAAAYVMAIAIAGPLLTRFADPIARLFQKQKV